MAKLKISAPDGKFLLVDVGDADKSEYDDLATAAVDDYMSKKGAPSPKTNYPGQEDWMNEPGLEDATVSTVSKLGTVTKAGYAGMADLIANNGLDMSVKNIGRVENDQDPLTPAGNIGKALGAQFTPEQIALQAGLGKVGEAIGPVVGKLMKGWATTAAVNAVGKIKTIAKALGVTNLDALGKFLLTPIKIGGREFEPIVTVTSSPEQMLAAAKAIKAAAGKELEVVSKAVDGTIKGVTGEGGMTMNVGSSILDLNKLTSNVKALKEEAVGDLPNLGKAVAKQYDDALKDLTVFIEKQAEGDTATMFSDLSTIKTKIGDLVYKHGSPLESKAALNDVYHAVSNALETAAKNVGGSQSEAYAQANSVYHQVVSVVEALEGKTIDAKKWFDATAFLGALSTGLATIGSGHGILAGITTPIAYGATKFAEKHGPQAIASGLNKGAPLVAKGIQLTARGAPVIGNAISQALQMRVGEE